VNVHRAGIAVLNEGDLVTFGHPQGEHLLPGTKQRQPDSDFQYIVSTCHCVTYFVQLSK